LALFGVFACAVLDTGCQSPAGLPPEKAQEAVTEQGAAAPITPTKLLARGKPEGVSVTANGLRSAMLSWSEPAGRVYRYRIERSESSEGPYAWVADVLPDKLTFTDGVAVADRLKDNATYYYRMSTIFDKFGLMSEPTAPVKTTTAPPPVPPATVKTVASSSRAVTVSWPVSASEGVTTYRVERAVASQPATFEKLGEVRDTTFVDGGTPESTLKDSSKYLYRVVAINRVDAESVPSAPTEVLTLPPPAAPLKPVVVSNEVRCVPLSWEASPETDVIRYDIYQARAAEGPFQKIGEVQGRTNTRYTDGGGNPGNLEDEGTYFYRVRAANNVTSESADSETVKAITRPVPPEVQQVAAVEARPREVPLSWAASSDTSVMGYEVWRSMADADDWVQIVRLNSRDVTSYLDRDGEKDGTKLGLLKDGTEYQYKVISYNTANVRSSASAVVRVKTKVIPVPPAGLTATTNVAGIVKLTWLPNPEKDVNGYRVETSKKADDGFRKLTVMHVSAGSALTAEEPELDPSAIRYYRLKALDKEGLESDWSPVVEGRAKPLPNAPTDLKAQPDGNTIRITWLPPSQRDVTQYKVWSKKFIGWDLVTTTDQPEYRVGLTELAKAMTLAVTAIDQDKQESVKSEPVKVDPLAAK
jgi:fibronectin type 3 domain-containing protein